MDAAQRIRALEEQVRLLAAGYNLPYGDPAAAIPAEVLRLAHQDPQDQANPEAVQALRTHGDFSLTAATRIVRSIADPAYRPSPADASPAGGAGGTLAEKLRTWFFEGDGAK
ncbi:MAG: hypothetical protein QOF26_571 [Baekduia sp.]|jgi:hypothetical protein|nr:hypothetical protein [Baekduia sp.]